jgi:hypothetical protein
MTDAKQKMKERMAKMRAAKDKKAKPPAAPKPVKQKAAIADTAPPEGKEFKTSSTEEPGEIRQKVWQVANVADITAIPEEHLTYFLHSMRIEVIKAIRAKKKISYFMFNERHALETHFKAEDVFE